MRLKFTGLVLSHCTEPIVGMSQIHFNAVYDRIEGALPIVGADARRQHRSWLRSAYPGLASRTQELVRRAVAMTHGRWQSCLSPYRSVIGHALFAMLGFVGLTGIPIYTSVGAADMLDARGASLRHGLERSAAAMQPTRRQFLQCSASLPASWTGFAAALAAARTTPAAADGGSDEAQWQLVRRQFPLEDGLLYLNAANVCPASRPVLDRYASLLRDFQANPSFQNRDKYRPLRESVRSKLAALLGVSADEVAITRNTSEGSNLIVRRNRPQARRRDPHHRSQPSLEQ